MDYLLIGVGAGSGIKQPVDDLLGNDGLRNDLFCIARLHLKITYLLRINHKQGASLTKAGAACFPDIHHFRFQALFFNLRFKGGNDICCAQGEAACSRTYGNAGLIWIPD